ncbi:MAG: fibronectin type III domain-containing protein [bacterium]|nr:fibronectin type III domain-containing protein [bacterium]
MKVKFFTTIFLLLFYFLFVPPALVNGADSQACDDNSPASKSVLTSAVAGKDSVTLTWTKALDPVTHYLVAYSRSETEIEFGNQNIGDKNTTTYIVGSLEKGVKYYFKVRPVNGCRPGDFSNKLSATPGVVGKVVEKKPNLSIYKPVQVASVSALIPGEVKADVPIPTVTPSSESSKPASYVSWQLLAIEAVLLIFYLYLAERNTHLKKFYSTAIPILMYVIFWKINDGCLQNQLTCKYFIPFEVIIFVAVEIAYKNVISKTAKRKKR